MKGDGVEIIEFTAKMAECHHELKTPVTWVGFSAIAHHCGIVVRIVNMSHPARLVRLGNNVGIQIKRGLDRTLQTRYGMQEMWHFWNDDIREACIYADEETVRHPREDSADLFAWYVTSPARVFLEPRYNGSAMLKRGGELMPDHSVVTVEARGRWRVTAVGESFYMTAFEQICGPRTPLGYDKITDALLVCENDNIYDPKAVRIEIQGKTVGYLSRAAARAHRKEYSWHTVSCKARIMGGWNRGGVDAGYFGVRLDI